MVFHADGGVRTYSAHIQFRVKCPLTDLTNASVGSEPKGKKGKQSLGEAGKWRKKVYEIIPFHLGRYEDGQFLQKSMRLDLPKEGMPCSHD